ncbi:MAG: hypothetical protein HUJ55_07010 [Ileibacterium sp.]|nr:hypothetical protein [Ileibacterium sp.]
MKLFVWTAAAVLWIGLLSVLKRADNPYGLFLAGSCGSFLLFSDFLFQPLRITMTTSAALLESLAGDLTGLYQTDFARIVLTLQNDTAAANTIYIQESLTVFFFMFSVCCLLFYPKYTFNAKILLCLGTFGLLTVCVSVYQIAERLILVLAGENLFGGILVFGLRFGYYLLLAAVFYFIFLKGRGDAWQWDGEEAV